MTDIHIRSSRPEDKGPVISFCQNTFEWGDYIPDVWDRWLADPNGRLMVAVVNDQPVAMMHIAIEADGSAWMEGMRVHPDYRRLRIGTDLDAAGRAWARKAGCRMARLATALENIPAQKALDVQGYVRAVQYDEGTATASKDSPVEWQVATAGDLAGVMEQWEHSVVRELCRGILPDPHWHWTVLTPERLQREIQAGQARVLDGGFALCSMPEYNDEFSVHGLVGNGETVRRLGAAARGEAASKGRSRVYVTLPPEPELQQALGDEGFKFDGGMLLYEQVL